MSNDEYRLTLQVFLPSGISYAAFLPAPAFSISGMTCQQSQQLGSEEKVGETHPSLIELQYKLGIIDVIVATDDHVLPPLFFDAGHDPLVDVLIEIFWDLCSGVNAHKHALHLDDQPVFDLLSSHFGTCSLNGHLCFFRFEMEGGASGVFWNVELYKIS